MAPRRKYSPKILGTSRMAASSAVPPPPKMRCTLSKEMFSRTESLTELRTMQEWCSPGLLPVPSTVDSGTCSGGLVVTVSWMLEKAMLRQTTGCLSLGGGRCPPTEIEMGPVTLSRTRLEKDMFSKTEPGSPWNLMGQPKTSARRQLEMVTFSAWPPPKRKTDQRVEK